MFKKITFFLGILFFSNRLMAIDDAEILEKGNFALETRYDFMKNQDENKDESIFVSLKYGLIEKIDFYIADFYEIKPEKNNGIEIGTKISLLKEKKYIPDISLLANLEFTEYEYIFNAILSKEIGKLIFYFNFCYAPKTTSYFNIGAIEFPINEKISLIGEIMNESDILEGLLCGNFQIFDKLSFDLGIGKGLNDNSSKIQITSGLFYQF